MVKLADIEDLTTGRATCARYMLPPTSQSSPASARRLWHVSGHVNRHREHGAPP
eukprot:COSAG01_NODE_23779_length_802_cov_0.987198_1_plen_53_part_10